MLLLVITTEGTNLHWTTMTLKIEKKTRARIMTAVEGNGIETKNGTIITLHPSLIARVQGTRAVEIVTLITTTKKMVRAQEDSTATREEKGMAVDAFTKTGSRGTVVATQGSGTRTNHVEGVMVAMALSRHLGR